MISNGLYSRTGNASWGGETTVLFQRDGGEKRGPTDQK
jgi:hypothetical protein